MAKQVRPKLPLGMVLIRVVTGAILLAHGWGWLKTGEFDGATVLGVVEAGRDPAAWGIANWWTEHVVLANADASAFLWRWAAFLIGVAMTIGALARPAALIGVFFLLHAFFYGPSELELVWILLIVSCFACAISGAGRRIGLDAMFDEHFPTWVTWSRRQQRGFMS